MNDLKNEENIKEVVGTVVFFFSFMVERNNVFLFSETKTFDLNEFSIQTVRFMMFRNVFGFRTLAGQA